VTLDFVIVGNPGNAADSLTGFGAVDYGYGIGKFEVTNAQYTEFLNSVDPTGANSLALYHSAMGSNPLGGINLNSGAADGSKYSVKLGYENMPLVFINFFDATRFTNWLHNGQGSGSTETGAYTLLGGTAIPSNYDTVVRNTEAQFWVPSENEWYKAAYHQLAAQGGDSDDYWLYPMTSNDTPFSDQPPGVTPDNTRVGNFFRDDALANGFDDGYAVTGSTALNATQNYLTNIGAYTQSPGFYGTFDQGGNAFEWNETLVLGLSRGVRGGAWVGTEEFLRSTNSGNLVAARIAGTLGFRVATVPEPGVTAIFAVGTLLLVCRRQKRL
jgi:sulfatase modifying factor 1